MRYQRFSIRNGHLARTLSVAGLSGLLLGLAARVTMRFVALEAGVDPGFSAAGSFEVVLFGLIVGTPAALLLFVARGWVRVWRPWAGLLLGLTLFAVLAALPPPSARSALEGTPDTPAATALAFAAVFAAWGLVLEYLNKRFLWRSEVR